MIDIYVVYSIIELYILCLLVVIFRAVTRDIIILLGLLPCILFICTNFQNRIVNALCDESINK